MEPRTIPEPKDGDGITRVCSRRISKHCQTPSIGWTKCPGCNMPYEFGEYYQVMRLNGTIEPTAISVADGYIGYGRGEE